MAIRNKAALQDGIHNEHGGGSLEQTLEQLDFIPGKFIIKVH